MGLDMPAGFVRADREPAASTVDGSALPAEPASAAAAALLEGGWVCRRRQEATPTPALVRITERTLMACHGPPRFAATPLALSSAAMPW